MKKIIAMLLTALFVLSSCAALADTEINLHEDNDKMDFFLTVPDGAEVTQEPMEIGIFGGIALKGFDNLFIAFDLEPDDSYRGISLDELTNDEIAAATGTITEDIGTAVTEIHEIPSGLKMLSVLEDTKCEYIAVALMEGYVFVLSAMHEDYSPLTDDEILAVKTVAESLRFEAK